MDLTRRDFLRNGAPVGIVGIAGCTENLGESPDQNALSETNDQATNETLTEPNAQSESLPAAVVSSHSLATETGIDILESGGTAADAAVTVAAVLSVVEPWFSSALGGGTWALYYDANQDEITSLDGVGTIGYKATREDYEERAGSAGIHQAIVPGAWDGWMLWLDRYGVGDLDQILAPAIEIAREGHSASPELDSWLSSYSQRISNRSSTAAIYERNDELLTEGDTVYQHEMADTFDELISAYIEKREAGRAQAIQAARDHFYRGPIADKIVAFSDSNDGYLTIENFHEFEAAIVDPISIDYNDHREVFQNPPNSQGITQLLALNVLKHYDLSKYEANDAEAIHLQTEAFKLAFADRYHHVGDPDHVEIPVDALLETDYANTQGDRIDMDTAMEWPIQSGLDTFEDSVDGHTTTFHIVDRYGNAAAVTTSLGAEFLVVEGTGIHINNRMRMTSLDSEDPNRLSPGTKVRHTSNPYMSFVDGELDILGGNTGVDTQPQGQVQQFIHAVEFGLTAQESVSHPRFVTTAFPPTSYPHQVQNTLQMEDGFSDETIEKLEEKGHDVQQGTGLFGIANMIQMENGGTEVNVGADPRTSKSSGIVK